LGVDVGQGGLPTVLKVSYKKRKDFVLDWNELKNGGALGANEQTAGNLVRV
jgi:hypothetical protein